jgi:hypothetical protein
MSKTAGIGDNLYVEGVDVSGDVGSVGTIATRKVLSEVTGINSSAVERIGLRTEGQISFNAWFNDAAGAAHPTFRALPTTDVNVLYARGTTRGNPCAAMPAKQINYDLTEATDGALAAAIDCQSNAGAGVEWGILLTAGKDTHATNGTSSTGVVGTQTTAGAIGFLQIFSIATGTLSSVLIEDSSDTTNGIDGTWGTLLTFSRTTVGAERKTVTGTIEKGRRLTTTGTFTNAVIACGLRLGTAQDVVSLA